MDEEKKEKDLPVTSAGTQASTSGKRRRKKIPRRLLYILLAIVLIALLAAGGYYLFSTPDFEEIQDDPQDTPRVEEQENTPTPTPKELDLERSEISIQVLNGSGIPGAAGDLQEDLEDIDYTDVDVGNADEQDYEDTQITFDEGVPDEARDEIMNLLEDFFADIDQSEESLDDFDVIIITGYPIGYTPTPTKVPEPTSTPTPTATDSATPTP